MQYLTSDITDKHHSPTNQNARYWYEPRCAANILIIISTEPFQYVPAQLYMAALTVCISQCSQKPMMAVLPSPRANWSVWNNL